MWLLRRRDPGCRVGSTMFWFRRAVLVGFGLAITFQVVDTRLFLVCRASSDWNRCLDHFRGGSSSSVINVKNAGTTLRTARSSTETIHVNETVELLATEPTVSSSIKELTMAPSVQVPNTTSPTSTQPPFPKRTSQYVECQYSKYGAFNATNISYSADQDIALPPGLTEVELGLCYLDQDNTQRYWINHFPHAAQTILPCWSFFRRIKEQFPNANYGFWVNNDAINGRPKINLNRGSWTPELLKATESCRYGRAMQRESFNENQTLGLIKEGNALVYRLQNSVKMEWRRPAWFSRPEDALSLQQAVFGHGTTWNSVAVKTNQLTIGLLQRGSSRRITNLDEIQEALQQRYPNATIEQATMDGMDFYQQAEWWAKQQIVVAAHGAAITNMIFMSPQAGLLEVFPQNFYELMYFRKLSESMGIKLHEQWFNTSVTDPEAAYHRSSSNKDFKSTHVTPPVEEIVNLVEMIVRNMTLSSQKGEANQSAE
jgi:Glycosyltransferase 61